MKLTRSLSFRARLILGSALLSGLVLLVFIIATAYMVFDNMTEEADQELRMHSEDIFETARQGQFISEDRPFDQTAFLSAEVAELRLISLESPTGDVIFRDDDWPAPEKKVKYTSRGWLTNERVDGRLWRVISRKSERYHLRMAIDLGELKEEVGKMVSRYLRALPVALILIALGAWWLGNRVVRPVRSIIATAEKITAEGLGERVAEVDSGDEIGRLTRVLNRMIGRLEAAFHQTRRFSSDASHELRTPLTVMQGKIEGALQHSDREEDHPVLADLLEQVQHLKSIVDSLLMFSRSDSGNLEVPDEVFDFSELVSGVCEDAEMLAEEAGIRFEMKLAPGVEVKGDARLVRLALFNLLQNAVKYNLAEDGFVRVELSGTGVVRVTNTGPEISGEDAEKVFDRFYRADPSRGKGKPGFGLGLSLARVIAEAHGGALWLDRSGGGETVFGARFG